MQQPQQQQPGAPSYEELGPPTSAAAAGAAAAGAAGASGSPPGSPVRLPSPPKRQVSRQLSAAGSAPAAWVAPPERVFHQFQKASGALFLLFFLIFNLILPFTSSSSFFFLNALSFS